MNRSQIGGLIGCIMTLLISEGAMMYHIGYHKGVIKSYTKINKELNKLIDEVSNKQFDNIIKWEEV